MRKTFGTVPLLRGNELPGPGRRGPASFKGQLFLEETSGNYYKALEAGPDVAYERVVFNTASEGEFSIVVNEDSEHEGFAQISLV